MSLALSVFSRNLISVALLEERKKNKEVWPARSLFLKTWRGGDGGGEGGWREWCKHMQGGK